MAKRGASSDLNHENWDRDEEAEDAGTFTKASEDTIKKRVIKVAKRRNPISTSQSDAEAPKAFGGFTGFTKSSPVANSGFSFVSNLSKPEATKTNGTSAANKTTKSDEYYSKLRGLNESVSEWIQKHVSENPLISLQPVFKDYDKYFAELEKLNGEENKTDTPAFSFASTAPSFQFNATASVTTPKFSFGITSSASKVDKPSSPSAFVTASPPNVALPPAAFGGYGNNSAPTGTSCSAATVTFSGSGSSTFNTSTSSAASLSFGDRSKTLTFSTTSTKPFTFASSVTKPITTIAQTTNNEETTNEDEPPKVEFKPVVEEGHIYQIRCKVFVKKDGSFGDRGVGNLFLKPVADTEKVQLIVRADTNLGNLLCNFILSEGIPMQRMGKKDVMLVCLPTPDTKPPPVPILLRVKTTEDADNLLETLQKHKK